ncbi:MAG: flagellin [Vampirovibrionales bacterium]
MMALNLSFNVNAGSTQYTLDGLSKTLAKSQAKLGSGNAIPSAAEDAAGLQLSERLNSLLKATRAAQDNIQGGYNVLDVTDGALSQTGETLQRMRELTVQAGNDTLDASARGAIQDELSQLQQEVSRTASSTSFNGQTLLNGSISQYSVQVGTGSQANQDTLDLAQANTTNPFSATDATSLGVNALDVSTSSNAQTSLASIDNALSTIGQQRASVGALSKRLNSALDAVQVSEENLGASAARIRSVDYAKEATRNFQTSIQQSASVGILAQSNFTNRSVAGLLTGEV